MRRKRLVLRRRQREGVSDTMDTISREGHVFSLYGCHELYDCMGNSAPSWVPHRKACQLGGALLWARRRAARQKPLHEKRQLLSEVQLMTCCERHIFVGAITVA